MTNLIEVVPYNPNWPQLFEAEATLIRQALGENCLTVHHVGSTAVPGLMAKSILDIIVAAKETPLVVEALEKAGYTYRGEFNIPFRLFFRKKESAPDVNLHVFEEGNPEIELNILFRDFLRKFPEALKEYAELKVNLLKEKTAQERNKARFSGYNLGKDTFIRKILDRAGFKGLCIKFCNHYAEWDAYHRIQKEQVYDPIPALYDRGHPTLFLENHYHFVLYRGTTIVTIAHVEFLNAREAALRSIATDESFKGNGYSTYLIKMVEKWVKCQGKEMLLTHVALGQEPFYHALGYHEMPFDDLSAYADSVSMGKKL